MGKKIKYGLMNVLIKGTSVAIQKALLTLDKDPYELIKGFSYGSKNVKDKDFTIVKAGLVFEWGVGEEYLIEEIPFSQLSDIRFIGQAYGVVDEQSMGTYVFYKDFEETCISVCYKFSNISPFMEEFDAQWEILEKVNNSFMDHVWQYSFLDYSCGEYVPWGFNGVMDKALIEKWKTDEQMETTEPKEIKIEEQGNIRIKFNYEIIDEIDPDFYTGINDGKDFIVSPDTVLEIDYMGVSYSVSINTEKKMNTLLKKYKKALTGKDVGRPIYNPMDVTGGKYEVCGKDKYGKELYYVLDDAEKLEPVQIAHRTSIFAKVNELLKDENAIRHIVGGFPKKNDGTLVLKSETQIASLFCKERDATMYVLCAVAKKDTEILIEVRQIASIHLDRTYTDIISISNLFREKKVKERMAAFMPNPGIETKASSFSVNDKVWHSKFGEGIVLKVKELERDIRVERHICVTVDFGKYGVKDMLEQYANLKKI